MPKPPPPPLVIRQHPSAPDRIQEPIYIREQPPEPPTPVKTQVVTIKPTNQETLPRKVIVERLATIPSQPQPIIIEKWSQKLYYFFQFKKLWFNYFIGFIFILRLPYKKLPRKVVFEQSDSSSSLIEHHAVDDSGYFPDLAFSDKLGLDTSVQEALKKMNQQIVQLKSELDEEKHKTKDLVHRISQLIRFD